MKNRDIEVAEKTWVNLMRCTREALETLPSGLVVGGHMNLWGCENLKTLPSGLRVGGFLNMSLCKNLKTLPSGLRVGGFLSLDWCEDLMDLPLDVQVAGTIYYNDATGFARDPEKFQEIKMRLPGKLEKF